MSDYKKLHPGGSLGMQMLQVQDIMHLKDKIPLVADNAKMKSVIIEMTKKSFGHVGVKNRHNKLVGIITDGDLRRNIKGDFLSLEAREIMSLRPKLILKDELVVNALNLMNINKITCLFIVNNKRDKKPTGVIHIHDCIRYAP